MYSLSKKVDSVRQAAVTLGLNNLKNWINLLALGSLENKPQVLIETAMIRARMCELIGMIITKKETAEAYFTVGLFSIIDAFFDTPLEDLVDKLSLNQDMSDALIKRKGIIGATLKVVVHHQEGHLQPKTLSLLSEYSINGECITRCYLESLMWAKQENVN